MRTEVLTLNMELSATERGLKVGFHTEIKGKVASLITKEEENKIREAIKFINEVINGAVVRDFEEDMEEIIREKEIKEELNELKKDLLSKLSKEEQERVEKFEKELDSFETDEEKANYAFSKLMESLSKLEEMMGE